MVLTITLSWKNALVTTDGANAINIQTCWNGTVESSDEQTDRIASGLDESYEIPPKKRQSNCVQNVT
jgi:hypothetical protein